MRSRLARIDVVRRFDQEGNLEAETLAQALSELEEPFVRILEKHLPRLLEDQASDEEMVSALYDLGEEFRHVLYHIKDPMYFRHLPNREDLAE